MLLLRPLLLGLLASATPLFATDVSWSGSHDNDWSRKQNWSTNNVPTSTDNAKFNSTFTNQPSTTAAVSVGGIWMTTGVGQNVTIGGTFTLTLAGNTINGTAGLGILIDNSSAFTLTINCPVAISATQAWTNNSGNLFTVGAINLSTFGLTVNGTGSTSATGIVSGSGTLTKSGTGTLVLSGTNTFSGSTIVSGGVLRIINAAGLGTTAGGTSVASGSALEIQNGIAVGAEALTLNGNGVSNTGALRNVSSNNSWAGAITLGSASVIGSDAGTLTLGGAINNGGFMLATTGAGDITISGIVSGSGGLNKNGAGTLTLSGADTFSGSTTISGGTLTAAAVSGSALGFTSSLNINSGGTFLLGASDQINNAATITLNGGTFAKGGFGEGSTIALGMGALNLTASGSHIDFGTGAVGVLTFASFNPASYTLTVDNWTGIAGTIGTSLTDRLIFNSDQSTNLSAFFFTGYGAGGTEFALGGGFYEVVPAVPEAPTYLSVILVLIVLADFELRRLREIRRRTKSPRVDFHYLGKTISVNLSSQARQSDA